MNNLVFPVRTEFDKQLPYYFVGGGCSHEQEFVQRPAGHPNYQWIQCRSGTGKLLLNGTTYYLERGHGMFLCPNEPHTYHAVTESWKVDCIIFDGSALNAFVHNQLKIFRSGVYHVLAVNVLQSKMEALFSAARSNHPTRNLTCSALVYAILLDILRFTSEKENASIDNQLNRLLPALTYIDAHFAEAIPLDTLANQVRLTPQYFCTLFKKLTSQTPLEYITMVKIRTAKEYLLQEKDFSVKKISRLVGFEDVSYFCSVFKRHESLSPTQFRQLYG